MNNSRKANSFVMYTLVIILAASLLSSAHGATGRYAEYEFAKNYTPEELQISRESQDRFAMDVAKWEARFNTDGVGVSGRLGVTYDGTDISTATGLPTNLHRFSAASKEGIHLLMASRAINGSAVALRFFHNNASLIRETLQRKLETYNAFFAAYPGFCNFLPWFAVLDTHIEPTSDWTNRVPALDNGEWMWGLLASARALEVSSFSVHDRTLAQQIHAQLKRTVECARRVFFNEARGGWSATSALVDARQSPDTPGQFTPSEALLLDPYEGELFVLFMDLFGKDWQSAEERDNIWVQKRKNTVAMDYRTTKGEIVTVQQGFWFSAHEQWKVWSAPYLSNARVRAVFENCERVRSIYSAEKGIPGLRASVRGIDGNCGNTGYDSDCGIPSLASQNVTCLTIVTPYGASPLLAMHSEDLVGIGFVYYAAMLNGTRVQGPFGSTASVDVTGTNISNGLTWDSKILPVLGLSGAGYATLQYDALSVTSTGFNRTEIALDRFMFVLEREFSLIFPSVKGTDVKPRLPTVRLPYRGGFSDRVIRN